MPGNNQFGFSATAPGFQEDWLAWKADVRNNMVQAPHIVAPTGTAIPNGSHWTTTAGLFARINGATVGPYSVAGAPAGSNTHVQYNNSSAFGGSSAFTWTLASLTLSLHSGTGVTAAVITTPTQVTANTDGPPLTIKTGNGLGSGVGGTLSILAGAGGATDAAGGVVSITGGTGTGVGAGGNTDIYGGPSPSNTGGGLTCSGGNSSASTGGDGMFRGGTGSATSGAGGVATLLGGAGRNGGNVNVTAGASQADGFDGGSVLITAAEDTSGAVAGTIRFLRGATRVATLHAETGFLNLGATTTDPGVMLAVESNVIRLTTAKTPASAGAAGVTGDMCWDANYQYVCVATNTWKRAAHATW